MWVEAGPSRNFSYLLPSILAGYTFLKGQRLGTLQQRQPHKRRDLDSQREVHPEEVVPAPDLQESGKRGIVVLLAIDRFWTKVESGGGGCGEATAVSWRLPDPKSRRHQLLHDLLSACRKRSFALAITSTLYWGLSSQPPTTAAFLDEHPRR